MHLRTTVLVAAISLAACSNSKSTESHDSGIMPPDASAMPSIKGDAAVHLVETDAGAGISPKDIKSDVKTRKDPRYPTLPLFEKMAVERGDRPADSLHAEALYDAVKADGLNVTNQRQVLGLTVGAAYCVKADVDPDIDLTVCEYDNDADAAKGKAEIVKVPYPRREVLVRRGSTVGIGRLSEAKPTTDAAAKIAALVKKF